MVRPEHKFIFRGVVPVHDPHSVVVTVLLAALLLIGILRRFRFLAPLLDFGIFLGILVGASATVLAAHLT